jgi:hypothetical protein
MPSKRNKAFKRGGGDRNSRAATVDSVVCKMTFSFNSFNQIDLLSLEIPRIVRMMYAVDFKMNCSGSSLGVRRRQTDCIFAHGVVG